MKRSFIISILLFSMLIIGACSKPDWSKKETVPFRVESNMEEGAELGNNALHVNHASLHIKSIRIEGTRLQGDDVLIELPIDDILDVTKDNSFLSTAIPIGTYDDLKVTIDYSGGDGMLSGTVTKVNGNPNEKSINIPIDYENKVETYNVLLLNDDALITIGEDDLSFILSLDLQQTLEGVGNGAWNGLITASQSQNNVDLTTIAGQNFLINFNNQLIEKTQLRLE